MNTGIQRAYLFGDPGQKSLAVLHDDSTGPSVAAPQCDCFLPVVALELRGEVVVEQPDTAITSGDTITLPAGKAERFYNSIGEGYYDPPRRRGRG